MKKLPIYISLLFVLTCAKDSTEDTSSVYVAPPSNTTNTTNPTPTPTVTQYTITVSAGEGGSVSTAGGTYNDGTSISITATPSEGYGFIGWNGSDSSSSTISVTLTANTTIEALFGQLPQLTLPETPSKMFTKGVGDTLSIGFSHAGGYKSTSLYAEYGSISVISVPNEGDTEGNIVIEYSVNTVENVDRMTTIAGFDDIEINISGNDDLVNSSTYQIRSQPEPIFKDYLKPSGVLEKSRSKINPSLIRYINQKDNSQEFRCQYINGGLNQFGNLSDDYGGIAFADFNGDGYDDMFLHPVYSEGSSINFSSVKTEYELYLYENGEYKYHQIDFGNLSAPKVHLAREILVGDYDNDGDPDLYSGNFGIDGGSYETEKSLFIINNYNIDGTFSYKENPHSEGVHEASSADIDNDGDLDIYSRGRLGITQPYSPFFKNTGNFELEMWNYYGQDVNIFVDDINSSEQSWQYYYSSKLMGSELIDVNKDGYVDLILVGFEWEKEFRILWGSSSGFKTSDVSFIPQVETPASYDMGKAVDIYVEDIDNDGVNEIIIVRTGGDNKEDSTSGEGIFYRGWYLQILKLTNTKQLIDVTNTLIEDFYSDQPNDYCGNPFNNWIYWIVVDDYDNDGNLDIYNKMMSNRPLHRWEWNGSKYIKVD